MKRIRVLFAILSVFLVVSAASCGFRPDIDVNKALVKTEEYFKQTDNRVTASAFDGKKDIKFRLMVDGRPSEADAQALFSEIMDNVERNSGQQDFWDYYNGHFDLKSYDDGVVIYKADKLIEKNLEFAF